MKAPEKLHGTEAITRFVTTGVWAYRDVLSEVDACACACADVDADCACQRPRHLAGRPLVVPAGKVVGVESGKRLLHCGDSGTAQTAWREKSRARWGGELGRSGLTALIWSWAPGHDVRRAAQSAWEVSLACDCES